MIDQIVIASMIGSAEHHPIYRKAKAEDEFYREIGSSRAVRFAAWITSFGMKTKKPRALPRYAPEIAPLCRAAKL